MENQEIKWVAETETRKFGRLVLPWNDQVAIFTNVNMSSVFPEDVVDARLAGYDGFSRTRLIPVKVKGKSTVLYKGDDIITPAGAGEIVLAHSKGKYPTRSTDFYDVVEGIAKSQDNKEPEDRDAIIVTQSGDHSWSREMPETRFALGPKTTQYFKNKVEPLGRTEIPFLDLQADSTKYATFNYVWFGDPRDVSGLGCRGRLLHVRSGALGVLEKTAEGGSRSPKETILTNIRNANSTAVARCLKEIGMTGLADKLAGLPEAVLREYRYLTE